MEDEVSSGTPNDEFDGDNIENKTKKTSIELNEDNIGNETEKTRNVENEVEDPKKGMKFNSIDELMQFYTRYANQKGFHVAKKYRKRANGEVRYVSVGCGYSGKPKIKSSNLANMRPQSKTNCKAGLNVLLCPDGTWILNSLSLDHNHELSPSNSRFHKCNRFLQPRVKRRLELNDGAGIRMNKNNSPFMVEAGGYKNLQFIENDCKDYIKKTRRLRLGEGDATAMHNYFLKMQDDNSDFFCIMDLNEKGRLRNVFWADARSRAAFKEFGDVVTFDTTYLVNKYDMPFAPFVGVNHHGQLILLGCGLISREDTETFTWLFQSWLTCMSNCPPSAIITDQDKAMENAIEIVFPNARHRWCLWHIMKKLPEKLSGYKQYESIKFCLQNVVYDSLTKEEFEESWGRFIEKYKLESSAWLLGLYNERHRWVPAFVKDIFWAGMSTTQRSESMHTFFDGYINSNTTLKLFLEQYVNALAKKVENENKEEFNSLNSYIPCLTHYDMEKQFQSAYTTAKFKEFQQELIGKICCNLSSCKEGIDFSEYEIREDISLGESHRHATFKVYFNEGTDEVNCKCRLFEFRGILCRHQIMVFIHREIYRVPDKYILKRWSKFVRRRHARVRISYDNWPVKPEALRFDKMCNAFYEVADLATNSEDRCKKVMAVIRELKLQLKETEDVCGSNKPITRDTHNDSTSLGDGIITSKESTNILDPLSWSQKGRPPFKRKQSMVEKSVKKQKEGKKKKSTTTEGNTLKQAKTPTIEEKRVKDSVEVGNVDDIATTVGSVLGTQESFNLNESIMLQSHHIGGENYDFRRGSFVWPNISGHPNITGMSPYCGQQSNMLQGGTFPFQPSMFEQGYDLAAMHPTNFTEILGMNDMAQVQNPKLHKDGRSDTS